MSEDGDARAELERLLWVEDGCGRMRLRWFGMPGGSGEAYRSRVRELARVLGVRVVWVRLRLDQERREWVEVVEEV